MSEVKFNTYKAVETPTIAVRSLPTYTPSKYTPLSIKKSNNESSTNSGEWYSNMSSISTPTIQLTILLPIKNGTIKTWTDTTGKHKYGHVAVYYNGNWYSDYNQGTKAMPYSSNLGIIEHTYVNPNQAEAERAALIIASRAGAKSKGLCARAVRTGFDLASNGKYKAEGYNGNNFGEYVLKRGWTQISKKGGKLKKFQEGGEFNIYTSVEEPKESPFLNPYHYLHTFATYTPIKIDKSKKSNESWFNNMSVAVPFKPTINNTIMNNTTTTDKIIDKIVAGKYATDPKYKEHLLAMVKSAINAKGDNRLFIDTHIAGYKKAGFSDAAALVSAAQDAFESGWGKHTAGTNNYGGLKGAGTSSSTTEYIGGKKVSTKLSFRNFKSREDYINYKANLLKTRYGVA